MFHRTQRTRQLPTSMPFARAAASPTSPPHRELAMAPPLRFRFPGILPDNDVELKDESQWQPMTLRFPVPDGRRSKNVHLASVGYILLSVVVVGPHVWISCLALCSRNHGLRVSVKLYYLFTWSRVVVEWAVQSLKRLDVSSPWTGGPGYLMVGSFELLAFDMCGWSVSPLLSFCSQVSTHILQEEEWMTTALDPGHFVSVTGGGARAPFSSLEQVSDLTEVSGEHPILVWHQYLVTSFVNNSLQMASFFCCW